MTDKASIIEQLAKARENKTPLQGSRVEGDTVATLQVSKRNGSNIHSEMSLYDVEDKCYLVLHEHKKYPSPEQIKNKSVQRVHELSYESFSLIVQGIINYREKRLQEYYINTYSYICGWCQPHLDIHEMLEII